jgi:hypothetical protein
LPECTIWLVLAVAAAMRVIALAGPPLLSTDIYRYVWDGRVQFAGVNPYRYIPDAPELASLRDNTVYPNINRGDYARTSYPPAAESIFALASVATPGVYGMKLTMTAFDLLVIAALTSLLRVVGRDPAELLIYAWLPLTVWEFAGNAHIDAAAAGLLALSLLLAVRGQAIWTGITLAAATLTKFLPVVVLPAFWRPWDWRLLLAFVIVLIVFYAPYVGVGWHVFGFLDGYLAEEGVASGSGIFLLQLIGAVMPIPDWAAKLYFLLMLGLLSVLATHFAFGTVMPAGPATRLSMQARQALILGAIVLVAVSPHYPWYFGWLAPLACLAPIPSVLWILAAAPLLAHGAVEYLIVPASVYVPAAILAVFDLCRIRRLHIQPQTVRSV